MAGRQHLLREPRNLRAGLPTWLEHDFRLSDFDLSIHEGQISLRFDGLWTETTMWEIYSLSAIDELKTRASLKKLTELELDILYARAKTRLWEKMARLRGVPGLTVSDFGTRRRHSFLWQEYVVKAMSDVLGENFIGSSNTYMAYTHDLEAIGTNAHELPMAMARLPTLLRNCNMPSTACSNCGSVLIRVSC